MSDRGSGAVSIRGLSEKEFLATFAAPMRRLAEDENAPVAVSLKDYTAEAITRLGLPTTVDDLEIHHVYVAHGERHTHVLFYFGEPDTYLVLVVDNHARQVLGHRILDLRELYGLKDDV
jgi:hypothetical protein